MRDNFVTVIEGLKSLDEIQGMEDDIRTAAYQAVNAAAVYGRTQIAEEIGRTINLPPGYLMPSKGRLTVIQKAQKSRLEAIIEARDRPTSLARFVIGNPQPSSRGGVHVRVKNKTVHMKRAFVMRLRAGNQLTESKFNLGLAVRLKPGEKMGNKTDFVQMKNGLYLLYGPSIDQIFRSNKQTGAAEDMSPRILSKMETEFRRLMERK